MKRIFKLLVFALVALISTNTFADSWFSNIFKANSSSGDSVLVKTKKAEVVKVEAQNKALQGKWTVTKDVTEKFGFHANNAANKLYGVRTHETYTPAKQIVNAKSIVLTVIHGTWASENADYHSDEKPFYRNIRNFATQLANDRHVPVEIISFRWEGHNNSVARQNAAVVLASLLTNFYADSEKITIAHSHGCNVVACASRMLDKGVSIDHIINIAAPVRDETEVEFKPTNFNKLTQFYSTVDLVAAAGAITPWNFYAKEGSIRKFAEQDGRIVRNIRTQINGQEPGHSSIKALVHHLPLILQTIETNYKFNTDLDLDVNLDDNIKDPVLISVRHFKNAQDNQALKNIANVNVAEIAQQAAKEYTYSSLQKATFKDRYNKDMNEKNNSFVRFFTGVYAHFCRFAY